MDVEVRGKRFEGRKLERGEDPKGKYGGIMAHVAII
jgi:hypothetical protein